MSARPLPQGDRLTFAALTGLEPRLGQLYATVKRVRDPGGDHYCASLTYARLIKPRLRLLVGYNRLGGGPDVLYGPDAWETAVAALVGALPPCRACGCL